MSATLSPLLLEKHIHFAKSLRKHLLHIVYKAQSSHVGSGLSLVEILSTLYCNNKHIYPLEPHHCLRDRIFLSKGHSAASLYCALALAGFFSIENLYAYCEDGSNLIAHVSHHVSGVEFSTGSLGHGLSVAIGSALCGKREQKPYRVFCILSDGELNEGSNWEGFLFAPHHKLNNLCVIVDYNKWQSLGPTNDTLNLEPIYDKFNAFGWDVYKVDGHNILELTHAINKTSEKPKILIAHTIKGKGVSFMEDQLKWHYKSPNKDQLNRAIHEIDIS